MTKKALNLNLVGQWTLIIIGLVGLFLRLENRLTTLEVLRGADMKLIQTQIASLNDKVDKVDDKVEQVHSVLSKTLISDGN